MPNRNILDFRVQAEQMMRIIEHRLKQNQRSTGVEFLILKFKALYEQGVASGRLYEKEGVYPYTLQTEKDRT
jgi:hypothetical protein